MKKKESEIWPISKYVGKYPKGKWVFVKDFFGTYDDALLEAGKLQLADPKTGRKQNAYRIWDQKDEPRIVEKKN